MIYKKNRYQSIGRILSCILIAPLAMMMMGSGCTSIEGISVIQQAHDPFGFPRPGLDQKNVPVQTSFFIVIGPEKGAPRDSVLTNTISVTLTPEGGEPLQVVKPGLVFADGYQGKIVTPSGRAPKGCIALLIDSATRIKAATTYQVRVTASSGNGFSIPTKAQEWSFTTEEDPGKKALRFELDVAPSKAVRWHGAHFDGMVKTGFCSSDPIRIPGYDLMDGVRKKWPKAWSLQRDATLTAFQYRLDGVYSKVPPNIVRERETRRITKIETSEEGTVLHVEDFFGHEQYGIKSNRPLSPDYHPGDEVLIADGKSDARAKVISADDKTRTVLVTPFEEPKRGWLIEYPTPLPKKENPLMPGLFPTGGCYLRKFNPSGTPHYYWGRLDKEWDIAIKRYNRRVVPRFIGGTGDLSIDGRGGTTAKDLLQLRDVTHAITDHIVERYGDKALTFSWAVLNEPDLWPVYWRTKDWDNMQAFYDYSVDGILRAFEDRGYDSDEVFIGGLELGAIFGLRMWLVPVFLAHCSPTAEHDQALPLNAAYADKRLDGRRSRRVEKLCDANNGKGTPLDFISIHAYNAAKLGADKLIRAKEIALETDAEYYKDLWVNSFECASGWTPLNDPAAEDSFLGNGYYSTWCADFARRLLARAAADPRYGYGETALTVWQSPNRNFGGFNALTQIIDVDDDGDYFKDRSVTIPLPVFNFLSILNSMSDKYWVLPEKKQGGYVVSGFASPTADDTRLMVYSHSETDTQCRSTTEFDVAIRLSSLPYSGKVRVDEYQFDKKNNSYYYWGLKLKDRQIPVDEVPQTPAEELAPLLRDLEGDDDKLKKEAFKSIQKLGVRARAAIPALEGYLEKMGIEDSRMKNFVLASIRKVAPVYTPEELITVQELAELHVTRSTTLTVPSKGPLELPVSVSGNGVNFVVITPEKAE
jgi:hypothetical protein